MQFWNWNTSDPEPSATLNLSKDRPTVIICGGSFNADDPSEPLMRESPLLEAFFDFVGGYIPAGRDTFKRLVCGPLRGKLELNYFMARKLLGLVSAVPGDVLYPETMTGGPKGGVDIVEYSYSSVVECFETIPKIYESVDFFSADAMAFTRHVFDPLFAACRDDVASLCDRLRLLTIFGISYGSNFCIEIENAFNARLSELGYEEASRARILASVHSLAVSNMANVAGASGPRFSTIYVEGTNDKLAAWMNPFKTPVSRPSELEILELAPHRLLVLLPVTVTAERWLEMIPGMDYLWLNNDKGAHYTPFYTMRCLPRNLQPELLERALRSMVLRYRRPLDSVWDALKPVSSLRAENDRRWEEAETVTEMVASARQK